MNNKLYHMFFNQKFDFPPRKNRQKLPKIAKYVLFFVFISKKTGTIPTKIDRNIKTQELKQTNDEQICHICFISKFWIFRGKTAKNSQKFVFFVFIQKKTGTIPPKIDRNIKTN